jgi:hypothetical protein
MPERAIRFAVGDGTSRCAVVWKCWNQGSEKSDVFLAARNLGHAFKASLHERGSLPHQTGEWHVGFDKKYLEKSGRFPSETWRTRFIDSWDRPADLVQGVTLAYRIITLASSVNLPVIPSAIGKGPISWYPPPDHPLGVETNVVFTAPGVPVSGWPGKRSMGTSLLGSFTVRNGTNVWVVARACEVPPLKVPGGQLRRLDGADPMDLTKPGMRAMMFGMEPDGSRVFYDVVIASAVTVAS